MTAQVHGYPDAAVGGTALRWGEHKLLRTNIKVGGSQITFRLQNCGLGHAQSPKAATRYVVSGIWAKAV